MRPKAPDGCVVLRFGRAKGPFWAPSWIPGTAPNRRKTSPSAFLGPKIAYGRDFEKHHKTRVKASKMETRAGQEPTGADCDTFLVHMGTSAKIDAKPISNWRGQQSAFGPPGGREASIGGTLRGTCGPTPRA